MSKEYIEREALEEKLDRRLKKLRKKYGYFDHYTDGFDEAVDIVSDEPAADVVEVVRCGECDFWDSNHISCEGLAKCLTGESGIRYRSCKDYCSRGKRRTVLIMRLIDADVLLDYLANKQADCDSCTDIDCFNCVIEYAIKPAPTINPEDCSPEWISVDERMPELIPCNAGTAYSEAVIVWTDNRKAMIAVWDGIDFLCAFDYWEAWGEKITHWMPLPKPPKGEQP